MFALLRRALSTMADWEEKIRLSKGERHRLVKLSTAPFERELEQLARTQAMLEGLDARCTERDALLEQVKVQQKRLEELRRLRIAKLVEVLPEDEHHLLVPLGDPRNYLAFIERCLGATRVGSVEHLAPELTSTVLTATFGLRLLPTRLRLTKFLLAIASRWWTKNRAERVKTTVRFRPQYFPTRSIASRSRLMAPAGAPPSIS